jgi:hypothetical protein
MTEYHLESAYYDRRQPDHLWCLHCQRTYPWGAYRDIQGFQMCPYDGCDGSTVLDGIDWAEIRRYNPEYPEVPTEGVVYEDNGPPDDDDEMDEDGITDSYIDDFIN